MEWQGKSAGDLGRAIEAGTLDPVALTEAMLAAIAAHRHGPEIYARTTADRARAEAAGAADRARRGVRRSALDGVPISWKDLFDTAGVATESGSRLLAGRVPEADAEVLTHAGRAGLVCLGKTHQTELAFSGLGLNPVTATPPCINDPDAVPGGSSSGAAASVAHGLAAAGIGSDTGGSVRIPAAWNDLVGLKTTSGRLSLTGVVPLAPLFDTVGPLTRTVEDAALLLAALEGGRPADLEGARLTGTRFLALQTVVMDDLRAAPATGYAQALDRLAAAGAEIVEAEVREVSDVLTLAAPLIPSETYGTWGPTIEENPEAMYPPVLQRFRAGKDVLAHAYVRAWQQLHRIRAAYAANVSGYDAVLAPSAAMLPPKRAPLEEDHALFTSENLLALRNTRIANLLGLCSLTLPTGIPSTGIMFFAPAMGEEALLRIGRAAEMALA